MKYYLLSVAILLTIGSNAQSDKYIKAMEPKVIAVDTTHSTDALLDLANSFERIADAEKTQWLPYYYAALCHVNAGLMMGSANPMGGNADKTDPHADKAEVLINKAAALTKDNSELWIVKKQINTLRMMGDPMNRYMTYGPVASQALEQARKLNPENPRVYLLEGQDKFYTPEQFGGSKTEAKKLFETASQKYDAFKPESSLHPSWGKSQVSYFMSQM